MDRLIAELEAKAAAREAEILAEAEAEAERILAEAEREVERVERVRLAERVAERTEAGAREVAEARARAAAVALRARAKLLERVFARAAERIDGGALPGGWEAALGASLALAFDYVGEAPAEVVCPPAQAAAVRAALGGAATETRVDPAAPAGFLLRAADGSVEVDGTWAGALERRRDELAILALERLGATA